MERRQTYSTRPFDKQAVKSKIQKRMVAVCDILGFSKTVFETPLELVVNGPLNKFYNALLFAIEQKLPSNGNLALANLQSQNRVGVQWFSDTVLIYSIDDSQKSLQELLQTISWLLFITVFNRHIRIRVGISYGDVYIDNENKIYVGPAIVEAYKMEQAQEWSGGALTKSAEQVIPPMIPPCSADEFKWPVIPYNVPIKEDAKRVNELNDFANKTLAINWTLGIHPANDNYFMWSKDKEYPTAEEANLYPDIEKKRINIKRFHDEICRQCGGTKRKD